MRNRTAILLILLLVVPSLLLMYQNAGRLSHDETPDFKDSNDLKIPSYFSDIYKDELNQKKPLTKEDYENWLYSSPLYKRLSDKSRRPSSLHCDSNDKNVICPKSEELDNEPAPMTFALDPLRTFASVQMSSSLRGEVKYDTSNGPKWYLKNNVSETTELQFQYDQGASKSAVILDIKW